MQLASALVFLVHCQQPPFSPTREVCEYAKPIYEGKGKRREKSCRGTWRCGEGWSVEA
jgi:hypothetical protein